MALIDPARFLGGDTFDSFLDRPHMNSDLWQAIYKRAVVSPDLSERVRVVGGSWNLLALNEDWCGDSVNILPYVAKLVDASANLSFRILRRDENLDIMDRHLTGTSRSIPVLILLNEEFNECGWWGPRPSDLQRWVLEEGLKLPKEERYKHVRTWYARDRGETTMREIVAKLESCMRAA